MMSRGLLGYFACLLMHDTCIHIYIVPNHQASKVVDNEKLWKFNRIETHLNNFQETYTFPNKGDICTYFNNLNIKS